MNIIEYYIEMHEKISVYIPLRVYEWLRKVRVLSASLFTIT